MNATPFNCCWTILSGHRCEGTVGVRNADIIPLCELHTAKKSDPSLTIPSAWAFLWFRPAGYFSLLNCLLSTVSHLEPEGHTIQSSVVRCICLTFYGSSKGCMSPKYRGICRMCPVSQMKVCVGAERDTTDLLFILKKKKNPARIKITQLVSDLQPNYPPRFP